MRSVLCGQNVVGIFDRTCRTEAQKIVERKAAFIRDVLLSVGNPSKDCQRFVDTVF